MIKLTPAHRLSIYLGHADSHRHNPLGPEIVRRARAAGLAGATLLKGIEGFGHSMIIHNRSSWWIVDRTPAILYVVDTPERIEAFLPMLADVADQCLISVDDVNVVEFS
jgi:hypothetical protein